MPPPRFPDLRCGGGHDGFLTVESEPGIGTTFRAHLPARESGARLEEGDEAAERPRGNGELVLLGDRDETIR